VRNPTPRPPRSFSPREFSIGTRGCFFWRASCCSMLCDISTEDASAAGLDSRFRQAQVRARSRQSVPLCENISIDYAVLERATNVVGIPAGEFGLERCRKLERKFMNCTRATRKATPAVPRCSSNEQRHYVTHGKLVALLGVKDLIVVDTPDAAADRRSQPRAAGGRDRQAIGKIRPRRFVIGGRYSTLNAFNGSTLVARRAGKYAAPNPEIARIAATAKYARGSYGLTPYK